MRSYFRAYALGAAVASCALFAAPHASLASEAEAVQPARAEPAVAVLAAGAPSDAARRAARAVYRSRLRPPSLDEPSARALVGDLGAADAAGAAARELAELRDGVRGEDAASRQVLAAIGRKLRVQGILVVTAAPAPVDAGAEPAAAAKTTPAQVSGDDAGAAAPTPTPGDAGAEASEAGADAAPGPTPDAIADAGAASDTADALKRDARLAVTTPPAKTRARLFLVDTGKFDAATYGPDDSTGWGSTVASLERAFPSISSPNILKPKDKTPSKPFYTSPWFWGGLGAAVLFGGAFYFATQDSGGETIHLQMKVPR